MVKARQKGVTQNVNNGLKCRFRSNVIASTQTYYRLCDRQMFTKVNVLGHCLLFQLGLSDMWLTLVELSPYFDRCKIFQLKSKSLQPEFFSKCPIQAKIYQMLAVDFVGNALHL